MTVGFDYCMLLQQKRAELQCLNITEDTWFVHRLFPKQKLAKTYQGLAPRQGVREQRVKAGAARIRTERRLLGQCTITTELGVLPDDCRI